MTTIPYAAIISDDEINILDDFRSFNIIDNNVIAVFDTAQPLLVDLFKAAAQVEISYANFPDLPDQDFDNVTFAFPLSLYTATVESYIVGTTGRFIVKCLIALENLGITGI